MSDEKKLDNESAKAEVTRFLKSLSSDKNIDDGAFDKLIVQVENGTVILDSDETTIEYTLLKPITTGTKTIDKLKFKEPTFRSLESMDKEKGDMSKTTALISAITGLSIGDIGSIKARDVAVISEIVAIFL